MIVGRDRKKASDIAAKFGAQILLLDDGMQHRRLARDYEVVVMDASDLFGQGYFLPRGFLRDNISSLKRADLIILNHAQPALFKEAKQKLQRRVAAPIIGVQVKVDSIQIFKNSSSFRLSHPDGLIESVSEVKVGAFCAIARP